MSFSEVAEMKISDRPDRVIAWVPTLSPSRARNLANRAVAQARQGMPKVTGGGAQRMQPLYGKGFFGIRWADNYVYFQDRGIRPFTMRNLAGKTIPMWVNDKDGSLRAKNPKIKTRTTLDGRLQVLIFRKAALPGTRKQVWKRNPETGVRELVSDKPASYPGAPGRIGTRSGNGQIGQGNVSVRWRHPGTAPRHFLNTAMSAAAVASGVVLDRIYLADESWRTRVHGARY